MIRRFTIIICLLSLITCDNIQFGKKEYSQKEMAAFFKVQDTIPYIIYSDILDTFLTKNMKIIEYQCRVRNVEESAKKIAEIADSYGGYLSKDNFKNKQLGVLSTPVSEDSLVVSTRYFSTNTLLIRLPNLYLNNALDELQKQIEYFDFKLLRVNDTVLERNSLYNLSHKEKSLNNPVGLFAMNDSRKMKQQIEDYNFSFSAIIVTMYQNPAIQYQTVARIKPIKPYQKTFGMQIMDELAQGSTLLSKMVLFIIRYWGILLLIIISTSVYWLSRQSNS